LDEINLDEGIEIALTALHADPLALLCGAGLSMADPSTAVDEPHDSAESKNSAALYGAYARARNFIFYASR
jgi:hypothetical protein